MEIPTIENLTDELLLEIFDKLDKDSLLKSVLVCKKWNQEIYSSTGLMKRFVVKLQRSGKKRDWQQRISNVISIKRKVINLKFHSVLHEDISKVVKIHKDSLRSLTFENCHINAQSMLNALSLMENLETITFNWCHLNQLGTSQETIEMKKLKCVKLKGCTMHFLCLFFGAQLTSFGIFHNKDSLPAAELKLFKKFLSSQKMLTTLKLRTRSTVMRDLLDIDVELKLNKITISTLSDAQPLPPCKIFFERHGKLVESLKLDSIISLENINFILIKLTNLKNLTIDIGKVQEIENTECEVNFTTDLRYLKLYGTIESKTLMNKLLLVMPKLETLSIETVSEEVLEFIGSIQKVLLKLSIDRFSFTFNTDKIFKSNNFPNLKEFSCNWLSFTYYDFFCDQGIIVEKISDWRLRQRKIVRALTHSKSIKHIRVRAKLEGIQLFFDVVTEMKANCKLESMELVAEMKYNGTITRSFFYHFPKDSNSWHLEAPQWK